ncbi:MAG: TrkA family potassium uptake protein [Spirochaetaceae bacterium]|jgi:trk system potassium uptake protein TrkA|nr:TrkA family potassium uptake protein [Spirochaetaceae bacterium]
MNKIFAVIGLGIYGRTICEILTDKGGEVIAIDNTVEQINRVKDFVSQAILLDSTDEDALTDAPFDQVDVAIIAIGDNIEASILTTTLLKQLGVPYIVARAVNKTHYKVLKQVGANEVINIEEDQGMRLALNLIAPSIMEKVQLSKTIIISELLLPKKYINQKLSALDLKKQFQLGLTALRRNNLTLDAEGGTLRNEALLFPEEDDKLLEGDILIMVGQEEKIEEFQQNGEL